MVKCSNFRHHGFQQGQLEEELSNLSNYIQHADLGMDSEKYFDMCEQLGTDPNAGIRPIDYTDLTVQSQHALNAFPFLPDRWDTMNGKYLGKEFSGLEFVFNMLDIGKSDWQVVLKLINEIIKIRIEKA